MLTIENKAFKNLLETSTMEVPHENRVDIFHKQEEDFSFVFIVDHNTLEQWGEIKLTGEQVKELFESATTFYNKNKPEKEESYPVFPEL